MNEPLKIGLDMLATVALLSIIVVLGTTAVKLTEQDLLSVTLMKEEVLTYEKKGYAVGNEITAEEVLILLRTAPLYELSVGSTTYKTYGNVKQYLSNNPIYTKYEIISLSPTLKIKGVS